MLGEFAGSLKDIFKGKVALVIGGGGTVSQKQAAAIVLVGADAVVVGRDQQTTRKCAEELRNILKNARILCCEGVDLRDKSACESVVAFAVAELGRIDYVIAGGAGNYLADFHHIASDQFNRIIDVDLKTATNIVASCLPQLKANNGSVILVSPLVHQYEIPFIISNREASTSIDLLGTFANELSSLGVRTNCVAPEGFLLNRSVLSDSPNTLEETTTWLLENNNKAASTVLIKIHDSETGTGNSVTVQDDNRSTMLKL